MTNVNFILLTTFCIIAYAISVDSNVAQLINLIPRLIQINVQRFIMMIQLHPKNPITNMMMYFKYRKIARELHEELKNANK
jgi:hypothetical protein